MEKRQSIVGDICRRCGNKKKPPRTSSSALCVECEAETNCKHFVPNGLDAKCEAGVDIAKLTAPREGSICRRPCYWIGNGTPVKCNKFEAVGIEYEIEQDRLHEETMRRFQITLPLIAKVKAEHKGHEWSGSAECPVCKGTLYLSHAAYNGHVWGKCETPDCLAWME